MPEASSPAKGTQPEGARSEAEASRKVREMFTQIAPRYDLLNHLLSLQLDRIWRARAARRLRNVFADASAASETRVLDLCCGTGDLAMALNCRYSSTRAVGVDFAHTMLQRAQEKSAHQHSSGLAQLHPIQFVESDALRLPFANNAFDLATTAFGFRNLANYEDGLREIARVLKPGGTLAILEFSEPPPGLLGDLYRWYFRNVLPRIGGFISGDRSAYTYLPASVSRFFRPAELSALMEKVGYVDVRGEIWTFGTVALHTGQKK